MQCDETVAFEADIESSSAAHEYEEFVEDGSHAATVTLYEELAVSAVKREDPSRP